MSSFHDVCEQIKRRKSTLGAHDQIEKKIASLRSEGKSDSSIFRKLSLLYHPDKGGSTFEFFILENLMTIHIDPIKSMKFYAQLDKEYMKMMMEAMGEGVGKGVGKGVAKGVEEAEEGVEEAEEGVEEVEDGKEEEAVGKREGKGEEAEEGKADEAEKEVEEVMEEAEKEVEEAEKEAEKEVEEEVEEGKAEGVGEKVEERKAEGVGEEEKAMEEAEKKGDGKTVDKKETQTVCNLNATVSSKTRKRKEVNSHSLSQVGSLEFVCKDYGKATIKLIVPPNTDLSGMRRKCRLESYWTGNVPEWLLGHKDTLNKNFHILKSGDMNTKKHNTNVWKVFYMWDGDRLLSIDDIYKGTGFASFISYGN